MVTKQSNGRDANGLAKTGVDGLDEILSGGLHRERLYLVDGDPGAGKTLEGRAAGEGGLYVTLSETKAELEAVAASHGWTLDGVTIFELIAGEDELKPETQYTMFHPSEVELSETTRRVLDEVERSQPGRVVFDSLSEMRLLAQNPLRYRRQLLALKHFFAGRHCTVMLLDDRTSDDRDGQLHSLAHGVVRLHQLAPEYGGERRRLSVIKMRGARYVGGYHDFVIGTGGLRVFPRLASPHGEPTARCEIFPSGLPRLDELLGGGLARGTNALVMGPAGCGKSSLVTQYALAAVERGEKVVFFLFDETVATLTVRSKSMGMDLERSIGEGLLELRRVDPTELSPGEFAVLVREAVERGGAKLVVIDSMNGYLNSMPEERFLTLQLHELFTYLAEKDVNSLVIVTQSGLLGSAMHAPIDVSYLADSLILLRYFETRGEVRQAISVVKNRCRAHERTIRELALTADGVQIGEPLRNFHGVLSGSPQFVPVEGR
jgi:circadian clock protein KaiC